MQIIITIFIILIIMLFFFYQYYLNCKDIQESKLYFKRKKIEIENDNELSNIAKQELIQFFERLETAVNS